jgi:hypothetical protein
MLIADKVQNKADFDLYHRGTHPESAKLEMYFDNWLRRLGVGAQAYQSLVGFAKGKKPCRSPYCECQIGQCGVDGFFDARGT